MPTNYDAASGFVNFVITYIKTHAVLVLFVSLLSNFVYTRYATPLRKYPGPVLASYSRLWQVYTSYTARAEERYLDVHRKYGPVVRIGPNEVSFSNPSAAADVFKPGKGFHKTEFYRVFLPKPITDIFTEIRERVHASKKRIASPFYAISSIQQHQGQIDGLIWKFLDKMDHFASGTGRAQFDLGSWLHFLAFDVLGEFAFAEPFGFLDQGIDIDNAIATISKSTYESAVVAQVPIVEDLVRLNPLWKYNPFAVKSNMSFLLNITERCVKKFQSSLKADEESPSLLNSLMAAHSSRPNLISMSDVFSISMGAIAAGSDSTASTMHTFVWHVLAHPRVHEKLVSELDDAPLSETTRYQDSLTLPYFQACLTEAMRLQPAFAMNISRQVPPEGATVDGEFLPGGTAVALNGWVLHRNKEVFGHDADVFRPERWLEASEEQVKRMERLMIHFGGGSHLCIGRHLALFEINKILPHIFRRYKMELAYPDRPLSHNTELFYNQTGLDVYLRRR